MGSFDFLASHWKDLAKIGELAEQYLYSDTNTCFIKMGMLAEHIVQYMLDYDGIAEPDYDNTHANRIRILKDTIFYREKLTIYFTYSEKRWNRAKKRLCKGKYISVVKAME